MMEQQRRRSSGKIRRKLFSCFYVPSQQSSDTRPQGDSERNSIRSRNSNVSSRTARSRAAQPGSRPGSQSARLSVNPQSGTRSAAGSIRRGHSSARATSGTQPYVPPNMGEDVQDFGIGSTNEVVADRATSLQSEAYKEACSKLSNDQQQELKRADNLKKLFEELDRTDNKHVSESPFRRGLRVVGPVLERLQSLMNFASPLASLDLTASTSLGLLQSVTGIAIGLCGTEEELSNQITLLLECIPAIDRCAEVQQSKHMKLIHETLVLVYGDLLKFYLGVMEMLKSTHFSLAIVKERWSQGLAGIVASFSSHTDSLSTRIDVETFGEVIQTSKVAQKISEKLDEEFVRSRLDNDRTKEVEFRNSLPKRADGTCEWIESDASFCRWRRRTSPTANFLLMTGDMGCGKTMTTTYVVDLLIRTWSLPQAGTGVPTAEQPTICSYFCKDDGERNKDINIYRSLLSQVLVHRPNLKGKFLEWYEKTKMDTSPMAPTQSRDKMREFLVDVITESQQWLFIVMDALDECEDDTRLHLFEFFQSLSDPSTTSPFKVFCSSRANDDVQSSMPDGTVNIQMKPSREEDRRIATHLCSRIIPKKRFRDEDRKYVVDYLSENADGCAIWIEMALIYLRERHVTKRKLIEEALEGSVPSRLDELYGRIFARATAQEPVTQRVIERALEFLAVAYRPLTLEELAFAVAINDTDETTIETVAELEEEVDPQMVLDLIRSFISTEGSESSPIRLVHQSLKELILRKAPSLWISSSELPHDTKNVVCERSQQIHNIFSSRCMKYLGIGEFEKKSLFAEGWYEADGVKQFISAVVSGDKTQSELRDMIMSRRPVQEGFGGFLAYASCFWGRHIQDSANEGFGLRKFISLTRAGSQRLLNWAKVYDIDWQLSYVDEWTEEDMLSATETEEKKAEAKDQLISRLQRIVEHDAPYYGVMDTHMGKDRLPGFTYIDPLVMAAFLGNTSMVTQLLPLDTDKEYLKKLGVSKNDFVIHSERGAFDCALQHSDIRMAKLVFERSGPILHKERWISRACSWYRNYNCSAPDDGEWASLFETLIEGLPNEVKEVGPNLLCFAAEHGCTPAVKQFFEVGARKPDVKAAIVEDRGREQKHQSVGAAAWHGYRDIVSFLCEQDGIENHLHHRDDGGRTVFHAATFKADPEIFQILISSWPEGVDVKDCAGESPLQQLCTWGKQFEATNRLECIELLLNTGAVDVRSRNKFGEFPLGLAVESVNFEFCRTLITKGSADYSDVISVSEHGRPVLKTRVKLDEIEKGQFLKRLCLLIPLSVSVDYLF